MYDTDAGSTAQDSDDNIFIGYTAGGGALVNSGTSMTAGVARVDWADRSWTGVTLTARGALIYNTSSSDKEKF